MTHLPAAPSGPAGAAPVQGVLPPLHASEMKLYLACPRKWHHAHGSRRVPRAESEALTRGRAVHRWLEGWWSGSAVELPEDPIARACCLGYDAYWQHPLEGRWLTEASWRAELGGVACAGTLDAVAGDAIVEHKTTSQDITPGSMYWRQVVTTDVQVSMYRAAFPGATILYDVIRKSSLRPLRAGKSNKESEDEYVERMVESIASEPERYYQRATVVRLESEDEAFARDVVSVDRLRRGSEHPRSAGNCFAYGSRCGYFDVCWGSASLSDDSVFRDQDAGR